MKTNKLSSSPRVTPPALHTLPSLAILLAAILATLAKAESGPQPVPTVEPVAGANASLLAVTWGDGVWVAVGRNGTILYSLDALDWTRCEPITRSHLRGMVYDRGLFVVVGDDGVILVSSDGIAWTEANSPVSQSLWGVSAGRGEFVAVGSGSTLIVSKDGRRWQRQRSCMSGELRWIFFARNHFVVLGVQTVHTSTLMGRWDLAVCPTQDGFTAMTVGPDGFVGVERNGQLQTSSCGRKWQRPGVLVPGRVFGLAWGGHQWVAVGEGGLTVAWGDGSIWLESEQVTCADLRSVHHAQGRFVAVGDDTTILVSDNAMHWAQVHP
jgi:hypothetical protein